MLLRRPITIVALALVVAGCASMNALPPSANAVNFASDAIGKTGWSEYQDVLFVRGIDRDTAFLAAKEGLSAASFTVKRASLADGFVAGSRGLTAYDWNVVAGVYFKQEDGGFSFKVISQGSKDFGFWGDHTARSWPQDVLRGIRNYIATESSITNPDRNVFQVRRADPAQQPK